jgi:hypothetical protein
MNYQYLSTPLSPFNESSQVRIKFKFIQIRTLPFPLRYTSPCKISILWFIKMLGHPIQSSLPLAQNILAGGSLAHTNLFLIAFTANRRKLSVGSCWVPESWVSILWLEQMLGHPIHTSAGSEYLSWWIPCTYKIISDRHQYSKQA